MSETGGVVCLDCTRVRPHRFSEWRSEECPDCSSVSWASLEAALADPGFNEYLRARSMAAAARATTRNGGTVKKQSLRAFARVEAGQTFAEYALLLSVIAVGGIVVYAALGAKIVTVVNAVVSAL